MAKEKLFVDLPRHKRKEMCIQIKNKMKGKNFYTPFDLSRDERHGYDIYFLSKQDKCIFYNAVLTSSTLALIEYIGDKAYEETLPVSPSYNDRKLFEKLKNDKILEILKFDLPPIYENIEINYDYGGEGVELLATLKDEVITIKRVDEFIQEFWDNGEQECCSATPIQFTQACIDELIQAAEKGEL